MDGDAVTHGRAPLVDWFDETRAALFVAHTGESRDARPTVHHLFRQAYRAPAPGITSW